MKLLFLGSGSAFTVGADNFHSNILLIDEQGRKLLIDCGSDIRFSLHAAGFSYQEITDIYISHLHADHVGGMEYIGITTLFDPQCAKPKVYVSQDVASDLWDRSLAGGMKDIGGEIADLNTYFEVRKIKLNGHFVWENIEFQLVRVTHVHNSFNLMPSYGLFFEINNTSLFLTTDTQLRLEENKTFYDRADVIFHDCETSQYPSPVHASYAQLAALPDRLKRKMWLYGYQPGPLPDACPDGFLGFVKRGQVFEISETGVTSSYS